MAKMYDAVIIGSGPAGHGCARRIAELGGKSAIIEKDKLGGVCTNYGCIPTKALHASASMFLELNNAKRHGIYVSPALDFGAVIGRKNRIANIMSLGVKKALEGHNIEVVCGEANIKDRNTVAVSGKELSAKNIVIATGAKPMLLSGIS